MQLPLIKYPIFGIINFLLLFINIQPVFSNSPPTLIVAQNTNTKAATEALNQGLQAIQSGKIEDAITAFREAIKLDPKLAAAHYNLGLALRQSGKLQPAADAFYQATQADPQFALAFANLGGALLEGNNLKLAKDYLSRALELNPNLGFAHYNMGLIREEEKNWSSAIASFAKAKLISQTAPKPAYHLGVCYLQ
jgi:tetratricopeptide (TPR) repeat protein